MPHGTDSRFCGTVYILSVNPNLKVPIHFSFAGR
jgi:hypothetical protein